MEKTIRMFAATVCAASLALALLVTCISTEARPANAAVTATYTLTDLGTLGGATIARDINDDGQVVGQSQNTSGQNRAFLWENGQMTNLGTLPGGNLSAGRGIDDSGRMVGFSRFSTGNQVRAFLAQKDASGTLKMDNLGTLAGFSNSEAWHINDAGVAVGRSFSSTSQGRAVLWENGQIKNIGESLGTPYSEAWRINKHGQVVGEAGPADQQAKAFLYDNNTSAVTNLDAVIDRSQFFPDPVERDTYKYSEAMGINNQGQVVGWVYRSPTADPEGKAFLYEQDTGGAATMVPLDPLDGKPYSRARDIDESGRVVGWSRGADGTPVEQFSATIWVDEKPSDLNGLIPSDSRWRLTGDGSIKGYKLLDAYGINASGQIVGSAYRDGNTEQLRGFLLTPDTTAPKVECGTADDIWHREDVSIPCTATDDGVGLADPSDSSFTLSTNVDPGTETADASTGTHRVCDVADNCVTAGPIDGNKVDKKAPAISVTTSSPGNEYKLEDEVTITYYCTDGGSGMASCSGPVVSGGRLDTTQVGQYDFTVEASDEVGNVASKTFVYHVIYEFDGFFGPVDNPDVLNRARAGSAIPVTFSLGGDQGLDIFAEADGSSFPKSGPIPCDSADPIDAVEQTVSANSSGLTYDAATDLYTYVWKTHRDWTGCRQLVVRLDDGKEYRANFKFVR